ncbi:hypothetical protein CEXT_255221 [Caerostris extrusa]|uniref:Uncharacterized protein n=1 Tax=Caerostris extrusa TaxID=172846 RepID=A0AAV4PII9_CAEEX|nr:hypothetical protein CEXT_255221 [Caerostris extrusa]
MIIGKNTLGKKLLSVGHILWMNYVLESYWTNLKEEIMVLLEAYVTLNVKKNHGIFLESMPMQKISQTDSKESSIPENAKIKRSDNELWKLNEIAAEVESIEDLIRKNENLELCEPEPIAMSAFRTWILDKRHNKKNV